MPIRPAVLGISSFIENLIFTKLSQCYFSKRDYNFARSSYLTSMGQNLILMTSQRAIMSPEIPDFFQNRSPKFSETRATLLRKLRSTDANVSTAAYEDFSSCYWVPFYYFAKTSGYPADFCEEQTQEFMAEIREQGHIDNYDPAKSKLRNYLLGIFRNHLASAHGKGKTLKKGGHLTKTELSDAGDLPDANLSPDEAFRYGWALTLMRDAIKLANISADLLPYVLKSNTHSQLEGARQANVSHDTFRQRVSRATAAISKNLRILVKSTVCPESPEELDKELAVLYNDLRLLTSSVNEDLAELDPGKKPTGMDSATPKNPTAQNGATIVSKAI
jgi:DNA-directed RNA polymerase specialized sigma24 family protein